MSSALRVILGVSLLGALASVGCDDGGGDGDGNTGGSLSATAGTNSTSGSGTTGGTGGSSSAAGVPLTPMMGWVDGEMNTLGIEGAMFEFADMTSLATLMKDFSGSNACISGEAAKVDMMCTPVAPATDCYGTFWGAAIGLNLNQPTDETTGMGGTAMPFDAGAKGITGFSFDISGTIIPSSLRFKIENSSGEFCNLPTTKPVKEGTNTYMFSDLHAECWEAAAAMNPTGETAKSSIIKIAWQVVTNTTATVPFNYCVSNVRALTQ